MKNEAEILAGLARLELASGAAVAAGQALSDALRAERDEARAELARVEAFSAGAIVLGGQLTADLAAALDLIAALEAHLVCHRVQRNPTEAQWRRLEKGRKWEEDYQRRCKRPDSAPTELPPAATPSPTGAKDE